MWAMAFVYVLIRHVGRHSTKNHKQGGNNPHMVTEYISQAIRGVYNKMEYLTVDVSQVTGTHSLNTNWNQPMSKILQHNPLQSS